MHRALLFLVFLAAPSGAAPLPQRLPSPATHAGRVEAMPPAEPDPPVTGDLLRFPCRASARENVAAADAHLVWLRAQRSLDLVYPEWWDAEIARAEVAALPWRVLVAAHGGPAVCWDLVGDEASLTTLRRLLGEDRYSRGAMTPAWRSLPE